MRRQIHVGPLFLHAVNLSDERVSRRRHVRQVRLLPGADRDMIAAEFREKRKLAGVPLGAISSCQWLVIIRAPTEIEKGKRSGAVV